MSADAITTVVENARRVVKAVEGKPWDVYRAVAPLFISAESYQQGLEIFQEVAADLLTSPDVEKLFPQPGYAPKEMINGQISALLTYQEGVAQALQEFSKLKSAIDRDTILTEVCYELMINLMYALLLRYVGPGANEGNLFKLAIYFALSRVYLIRSMRCC